MVRCPNCGSTAQLKLLSTEYNEDGWDIEVVRYYICGCGETSIGRSYYKCEYGHEFITHYPRANLQEKLYGRG